MKQVLDIPYKEQRGYVAGNDIFDFALQAFRDHYAPDVYIASLIMRKMAHNLCELRSGDEPKNGAAAVATFKLAGMDNLPDGYLVETEQPVTTRIPYPEEDMLIGAEIEGETIRQGQVSDFSSIEEIVALTKALHNSVLPLDSGKWIFIRTDLSGRLDQAPTPFTIRIVNKLGGRATVSDILADGAPVGRIHFGVYTS